MSPLVAWILRVLLVLSPAPPAHPFPGFAESPWEHGVRLIAIARDVGAAVEDACGEGKLACQRHWSAVLLAVARHESDYALDVDAGRCYRGRDGKGPRCDGGRAFGLWQLQGSREEGRLWATDRRAGAREALRRIRRSLGACRALEAPLRLTAYAGGTCSGEVARRRSRELWTAIERARAVR